MRYRIMYTVEEFMDADSTSDACSKVHAYGNQRIVFPVLAVEACIEDEYTKLRTSDYGQKEKNFTLFGGLNNDK